MPAQVLNILIPAVVIAYAAYLIARMFRRRGRGCGGCSGCPMADSCGAARDKKRKEKDPND